MKIITYILDNLLVVVENNFFCTSVANFLINVFSMTHITPITYRWFLKWLSAAHISVFVSVLTNNYLLFPIPKAQCLLYCFHGHTQKREREKENNLLKNWFSFEISSGEVCLGEFGWCLYRFRWNLVKYDEISVKFVSIDFGEIW